MLAVTLSIAACAEDNASDRRSTASDQNAEAGADAHEGLASTAAPPAN